MSLELSRREIVAGIASVALAPLLPDAATPLTRFAFGACGRQNKPQPIWDVIAAAQPALFLFIGDCVYGDTTDPAVLRAKYQELAAKPQFRAMREKTPFLTMWDDHDYGTNDCGAEHPGKIESRTQFCDFWGVPADSERRTRADGIYTSQIIGPSGQEVQFILPDLRWNRTKLRRPAGFAGVAATWVAGQVMQGVPVKGPYRESRDADASMIGETQWAWLEAEFAKPAALRVFCSSLQVLAQGSGWEGWENYPKDLARLEKLIGDAGNVVLLSGDVHYGELMKKERANAPALWEITSSGITESDPFLPNHRRFAAYKGQNFGVLDIDWASRQITAQVRDDKGAPQLSACVPF